MATQLLCRCLWCLAGWIGHEHTEAWIKLPPFCRWHIPIYSLWTIVVFRFKFQSYDAVQLITILFMALRWQQQNLNQTHGRAMGCLLREFFLYKIDRVITAPHYICVDSATITIMVIIIIIIIYSHSFQSTRVVCTSLSSRYQFQSCLNNI